MPSETQQPAAIGPGLHHFMHLQSDSPTRFHLRVDPDGAGILLANAAQAARLSPVGVLMVQRALTGLDDEHISDQVRASFGGSRSEIAADLERVRTLIALLASPDDNYPITDFAGADESPYARRLGAPFQAHVVQGEPDSIEPILRALWDAGVPQVTLLAQPDADTHELVRLVECAEDIGMIAGIRALAGWLSEETIHAAAMAGLDFLTLVLASHEPAEHDALLGSGDHAAVARALPQCRDLELCPVTQVPLTDATADELDDIVEFVLAQGAWNFSFFAVACLDGEEEADAAGALPARALPQVATLVTEYAEEASVRFIWEPPVRWPLVEFLVLPALLPVWYLLEMGMKRRRGHYLPAIASVEGAGVKRGLTAPEAAILLEMPLGRVLTLAIFGLLRKGVLRQIAADPLRVQVAPEYAGMSRSERQQVARQLGAVHHGYEQSFIDAIDANPGRPVSEIDFSRAMKECVERTARRVRGFDVEQTRDYYRYVVDRAWAEANTIHDPQERTDYADNNLLWLLADEDRCAHFDRWHRGRYYYRTPWTRVGPRALTGPQVPPPVPTDTPVAGRTSFSDVAASFAGRVENLAGNLASTMDPVSVGVPDGGIVNLFGVDTITLEVLNSVIESKGGGGWSGGGGCACAGCACACACAGGGR